VRHLSVDEARKIAVRSGLGTPQALAPRIDAVLAHLGMVQLDSISRVARAHQIALAARLPLSWKEVDHALWGDDEVAFEFNAHAASLIPMSHWSLWEFRRQALRTADIDWRPDEAFRAEILERVANAGEVSVAGLQNDLGDRSSGWTWSRSKTCVQYLLWTGELCCSRREGWTQVLSIPSPDLARGAQNLPTTEGLSELGRIALRSLGVATVRDIAEYLRLKPAQIDVDGLDGAPVTVGTGADEYYLAPEAEDAPSAEPRLLSLFDNVLWNRRRNTALFAFNAVLEAYKRAADRKYGYYVCAVVGDHGVYGWADIRTDRAAGLLEVSKARCVEGSLDRPVVVDAIGTAMRHVLAASGTDDVVLVDDAPAEWRLAIKHMKQ